MKALILLILLPLHALAIDIDLGIGMTKTEHPEDGLWYQEPFPYNIEQKSPSGHIGLRFHATDRLAILIGYKYLGSFSSTAQASASDINYAEYQAGESKAWPMSTWEGSGKVHGIYGLAEYKFKYFHIKVGGWVHRSEWKMRIPNWRCATNEQGFCSADRPKASYSDPMPLTVEADSDLNIRWVLGIGKTVGPVSLNYEVWTTAGGGGYPATYLGKSQNISLTYTF